MDSGIGHAMEISSQSFVSFHVQLIPRHVSFGEDGSMVELALALGVY